MSNFFDITGNTILMKGNWVTQNFSKIEDDLKEYEGEYEIFDAKELEEIDTAGCLLLVLQEKRVINFSNEQIAVYELVKKAHLERKKSVKPEQDFFRNLIERLGIATLHSLSQAYELVTFIGQTIVILLKCLLKPSKLRHISIFKHMEEAGINAIPIVVLIAFLISIVLAYQGVTQLKNFGAEIFTVNLVTVSVLREMGVLLTAIMIAGRSGSAFTAEIGVMKVNEEVDAMRVIGINPFEALVLPRLIALLIVMPLLTFLANVMGLLGGAIALFALLDISFQQFLSQVREAASMNDFLVGMIKAPVFALLIAVVGCMRGMQVTGSAESVGRQTTMSVVESIFLVLLTDALFSIFFSEIGM